MIDVRVVWVALFSGLSISAMAQPPELSGAWVRAMPPGQRMTAVYMDVKNVSPSAIVVLGATSTLGDASLHETRVENGQSSMRAVDQLDVAAGASLAMAPGGLHIMLMGLRSTPVEGSFVPVCLQTSAGETCTEAPVQRGAPDVHKAHADH